MSKPTDTLRLLRDLQETSVVIRDIQRKATEVLQRIADSEANVGDRLANAAIAAGMPPNRAFDYAEEYAAVLGKAQSNIVALSGAAGDLKVELDTLIHIATVVPHRCPNHGVSGGSRVLALG
jgi:pyruvoyl-dependent arginine decarboxylase (PvlArgDC)